MSTSRPDWGAVHAAVSVRLHRVARSVLRDEHEAEDAVQDAYLKALGSIHRLRDPEAICSWLHSIARCSALDRLRRTRRRPGLSDELRDAVVGREPAPSNATEVAEALARMPDWMRRALEHRARGLRLAEYAAVEGITVGAAKTRLSRARTWLRLLVSP